ncbi:fibronectin type III domain-containing protein [Marinobacter sp. BGYM27]|uniref:fibronectin type III domain-containing protein n=1 Tax=Marinobacter sp. BGYM27 TaxID=2975597 RepID=UPI0021A25CF3|nr:fibronectin type III domain-containing protein [Marinobacter sp. BGYM27]MDG5498954.1 fibronectin type III domain-containing protein [Marinobacter sp. BGYM27]
MPNDESWSLDGPLANPGVAIEVLVSTGGSRPSAPPDFTVVKSTNSITAVVTQANGATSYKVRVNSGSGVSGLTASGLDAETEYPFSVMGINADGASEWSTAVDVTTSAESMSGGTEALGWVAPEGSLAHGATLRVLTDGTNPFGAKSQAVEAFRVDGDTVYEDGVENTAYQGLSDGDEVTAAGVWVGVDNVYLDRAETRHARVGAVFTGLGKTDIGQMVSVGGLNNPRQSDRVYFSYQIKHSANINTVYRYQVENVSGVFDEGANSWGLGEAILIGGDKPARIIHIDDSASPSYVYFDLDDRMAGSGSQLQGETIVGQSSGATADILSASTYLTPSAHKYIRADQDGSGSGFGFIAALPLRQWWSAWDDENSDEIGRVADLYPITAGIYDVRGYENTWHRLEFIFDFRDRGDGLIAPPSFLIDGREWLITEALDPQYLNTEKGLAVYHGVDAAGAAIDAVRSWYGEEYYDTSLQRVMLSDEPAWAEAKKNFELCSIASWSTSQIEVTINRGQFSDGATLYLYVADDNGDVNSSGVEVSV